VSANNPPCHDSNVDRVPFTDISFVDAQIAAQLLPEIHRQDSEEA
jgi:hypothetical protein